MSTPPALWDYSYGGAGAVWDVWRHDDADELRAYVEEHVSDFVHHGKDLSKAEVG
jgi:hypothetical protein